MRWPRVSLWGVLWLWVPLAGGRPLRLERLRGDTRALTRTLSARIQRLQLFPLGLQISGLEAIPGGAPPEGLGAMAQRLHLFQRLLGGLSPGHPPLAQIANDTENLRSLLATWAAYLGCPPPPPPPPPPPSSSSPRGPPTGPPNLPEPLAEAPHTAAGITLARLRACLDGMAQRLDGHPPC